MSKDKVEIDHWLAAALCGTSEAVPSLLTAPGSAAAILERINYHGVAGLLADAPGAMDGWPVEILAKVRALAVLQAMWELRHRQLLGELLAAFAGERVYAILLKGTALAYDLYRSPATRARGDTDLLIDPLNLERARLVLERTGFTRLGADHGDDAFALQEVWHRTCHGGMAHLIDLHWQLLNAPALKGVLGVAECFTEPLALPRLGPDAVAMDRVRTLIHTCIHRMMHFTSPYFVDDQIYHGGDRLIWLHDIHLLAEALSPVQWQRLGRMAHAKGVAAACLDGLVTAQRFFATPIPPAALQKLCGESHAPRAAAYLRARQLGRAWQDLRSIRGLQRKLAYIRARSLPPTSFMRDKYPRLARLPVPLLYARRLFDLLGERAAQGRAR